MFASAGEKLTDFDLFHPDRMASRILDMGDVMTLIEQAEKTFDQEQAAKAAAKLTGQGGEFTLDDFLEQMQQVRKLGSMSKIMGMLPGMGQFRDQLENFDEREIDRIQAVIQSMTPAERANPKMIDGSRRARIAKGSGRQVSDVNQLVDRFFEARKMMMSMAKGGGMPGMPGMPGMRGGGKRAKAKQAPKKGKGKRVSGNPAKAAQQAKADKEKAAAAAAQPVRQPGRRGDRLREGRRRARPAQGLLQVPRSDPSTHLVVDGANVVGSRPDGWWKDRAGAARRLHEALLVADTAYDEVVLVLEGAAKGGVRAGRDGHVRTVHAKGEGDDTIVAEARAAAERGDRVVGRDRRPRPPGAGPGCRRRGARPVLAARPARRSSPVRADRGRRPRRRPRPARSRRAGCGCWRRAGGPCAR